MYHLEELTTRFKDLNISALGDWGANIYLDKCVVTVYWSKKNKYNINTSTIWHKYSDLNDFMNILDKLINPPVKVADKVKEIVTNDNGTVNCIEHTKKKIKLMEAGNGNPNTILILKQLVIEFEQYL